MIQVLYILIVTSLACSLLGVFLVIRNMAMLSDAISHSVLLGIVLAFFVVKDLSSIYLIIAASISGLISCICIELLAKAGRVSKDSAVGIIFTLFFSVAVILISKFAKNAHLDVDMVLMGEVILAPFDRMRLFGISLPRSLVVMGIVLVLNVIYLVIYFRNLMISGFDEVYAKTVGIRVTLLYYIFMSMVSVTAVAAFDTVGAILTISFFISPAASAYLITKRIKNTIFVSVIYAIINSTISYYLSIRFNVSMSGMCAAVSAANFFLTFLLFKDGLIRKIFEFYKKRKRFRDEMLLLHIGNHSSDDAFAVENGIKTIGTHIAWSGRRVQSCIRSLINKGYVFEDRIHGVYMLTKKGQDFEAQIKQNYGI